MVGPAVAMEDVDDRAFWMLMEDQRDQTRTVAETNRQVSVAVIELRAALNGLHGRLAALETRRRPCPELEALAQAWSEDQDAGRRQAERREDRRWALWARLVAQAVVWAVSVVAGAAGALWAAGK